MTIDDLLTETEAEAAAVLHVSARTLRDLRSHGMIRYVRPSPRTVLYRANDLAEYIERSTRQERPPQPTTNRPKQRITSSGTGFMEKLERRRLKRLAEK